jgi:hypothetical protein
MNERRICNSLGSPSRPYFIVVLLGLRGCTNELGRVRTSLGCTLSLTNSREFREPLPTSFADNLQSTLRLGLAFFRCDTKGAVHGFGRQHGLAQMLEPFGYGGFDAIDAVLFTNNR